MDRRNILLQIYEKNFDLAELLISKKYAEKCVVLSYGLSENKKETDQIKIIREGSRTIANNHTNVNWNDIPALDEDIMKAFLPYESMAIRLGVRECNLPIQNYETEKRNCLLHLRYWNWIIKKYELGSVFFLGPPHNQEDYIVYALSIILDLKILIITGTSIVGPYCYGDRIETIGSNIEEIYREVEKDEVELHNEVLDFYNNNKKAMNYGGLVLSSMDKNVRKKGKLETEYCFWGKMLRPHIFLSLFKYGLLKHFSRDSRDIYVRLKKTYCYTRYEAVLDKEYEKRYASPVRSEGKYVLFLLQFSPEATTLPIAGVFVDQYTSIQLLARICKPFGIKVLVKDHNYQLIRDKSFYDEIKKIDNAVLVSKNENTYELIRDCFAVATQTGSCILESSIMGKPSLVFGDGAVWKGLPSMFRISGEEQGKEIMSRLLSGKTFTEDDILRYMKAIELGTIRFDCSNELTAVPLNMEELADLVYNNCVKL